VADIFDRVGTQPALAPAPTGGGDIFDRVDVSPEGRPIYRTTVALPPGASESPRGFWGRLYDWTVGQVAGAAQEVKDTYEHGSPLTRGMNLLALYHKEKQGTLTDAEKAEMAWLEQHAPQPAGFEDPFGTNPMSAPIPATVSDVMRGDIPGAAGDILGGYGVPAGIAYGISKVPPGSGTALKAAAKAGGPDIAKGTAGLGAGLVIGAKGPLPGLAQELLGVNLGAKGAAQIGRGLGKAYQAGREAFKTAGEAAAPEAAAPAAAPEAPPAPTETELAAKKTLDDIAMSPDFYGRPFDKLTEAEQNVVRHIASKLGTNVTPAAPAAPPTPQAAPPPPPEGAIPPGTTIRDLLLQDIARKRAEAAAAAAPPPDVSPAPPGAPTAAPAPAGAPPRTVEELSNAINQSLAEGPQSAPKPEPPGPGRDFAAEARAKRAADAQTLGDYLIGKGYTSDQLKAISHREQWRALAQAAGADVPTPKGAAAVIDYVNAKQTAAPMAVPPTPELNDIIAAEAARRSEAARATAESMRLMRERPYIYGPQPPEALSLSDRLQAAADAANQRMRDRGTFSGKTLNSMPNIDDLGDLAIWGAAKLAGGTIDFAKWSKEMAGEFGDMIRPHLENIYANAQKIYYRHITSTGDQLPKTKALLKMIDEGKAGADWYDQTRAELENTFGPKEARTFVDFLGATTNNATPAQNLDLALRAYGEYRTGQPWWDGYLPVVKKQLDKAVAGEPLGGPKAKSFRANLFGDPDPVTVDRWMQRAFGFRKGGVTEGQYKFIDYWTTQLARRVGMEPRQAQAAIWDTIRKAEGTASESSGQSFERLLPERLARDPGMQDLIRRAKAGEPVPSRP
jgi:hypothetical protein